MSLMVVIRADAGVQRMQCNVDRIRCRGCPVTPQCYYKVGKTGTGNTSNLISKLS